MGDLYIPIDDRIDYRLLKVKDEAKPIKIEDLFVNYCLFSGDGLITHQACLVKKLDILNENFTAVCVLDFITFCSRVNKAIEQNVGMDFVTADSVAEEIVVLRKEQEEPYELNGRFCAYTFAVKHIMARMNGNEQFCYVPTTNNVIEMLKPYQKLKCTADNNSIISDSSFQKVRINGSYCNFNLKGNETYAIIDGNNNNLAISGYKAKVSALTSLSKIAFTSSYGHLAIAGSNNDISCTGFDTLISMSQNSTGNNVACCGMRNKIICVGKMNVVTQSGHVSESLIIGYHNSLSNTAYQAKIKELGQDNQIVAAGDNSIVHTDGTETTIIVGGSSTKLYSKGLNQKIVVNANNCNIYVGGVSTTVEVVGENNAVEIYSRMVKVRVIGKNNFIKAEKGTRIDFMIHYKDGTEFFFGGRLKTIIIDESKYRSNLYYVNYDGQILNSLKPLFSYVNR